MFGLSSPVFKEFFQFALTLGKKELRCANLIVIIATGEHYLDDIFLVYLSNLFLEYFSFTIMS